MFESIKNAAMNSSMGQTALDQDQQRMYNAMQNQAMSSTQQGTYGAIANGAISGAVISNGASGTYSGLFADWKKPGVHLSLNIDQVTNGFIVRFPSESHIAATLEDVTTIILSEMASRMLEASS
jgi:hypothetical protein